MTYEWLVVQEMVAGSIIVIADNASMTNKAWTHAAPYLMKGYCQLPIVKDDPDWDIIEFLYGCKGHEDCYHSNKVFNDSKWCSIKEKSQSSHASQVYDQKVAQDYKRKASTTLETMQQGINFPRRMTP